MSDIAFFEQRYGARFVLTSPDRKEPIGCPALDNSAFGYTWKILDRNDNYSDEKYRYVLTTNVNNDKDNRELYDVLHTMFYCFKLHYNTCEILTNNDKKLLEYLNTEYNKSDHNYECSKHWHLFLEMTIKSDDYYWFININPNSLLFNHVIFFDNNDIFLMWEVDEFLENPTENVCRFNWCGDFLIDGQPNDYMEQDDKLDN